VDPAADAEAMLWEISVADAAANNQYPYTVYNHYLRIKIFNDRGVKKFGTVDIEYSGKQNVSDLSARTIQPDGSIQELTRSAVFDRVIEKRNGRKLHARSFALPGVKPGSIIEYRWRESHDDELANYVRLPAQRDIPVEHLVYRLKPLVNPYFPYKMRFIPFNLKLPPFQYDAAGYAISTVDNLPAFKQEEDAPPDSQISSWVLIYYDVDRKDNPDKFWKAEGKNLYGRYKPLIKVNDDVKDLAAKITAGSATPEEKLNRLYNYCQNKLKDLRDDDVTEADREKAKENRNTADTLKRGIATPMDIQLAFAALALGSGYEARVAYLPDRGSFLFDKSLMSTYFLPAIDIAVKVNDHWRLYDVTSRYLKPGEVRWQEEGVEALITDDKNPVWISIPLNDPTAAQFKRTGVVHLDPKGNLEGDLHEVLTGHAADDWRLVNQKRSPQEREKQARDSIEQRLPGAEIKAIKVSDPENLSEPVTIEYHVKVQSYATRTGKRLFLIPAFFEFNLPARYTESGRTYDIRWRYPWSEVDDVSIELPPGFELDHADAPGSVSFEPVGAYSVKVLKMADNRILYHRELIVGKNGNIGIPQNAYLQLKKVFDTIHDADTHMLTLKMQTSAQAAN
jgi:transglutaminase-like putative cysteine protease